MEYLKEEALRELAVDVKAFMQEKHEIPGRLKNKIKHGQQTSHFFFLNRCENGPRGSMSNKI
jgi:hypothetical protein